MATPPTPKIKFAIVLEGERTGDTTHAHTLRYLLKYLLRARSLRCVDARELKDNKEGGDHE
jgi:hypothetical protein